MKCFHNHKPPVQMITDYKGNEIKPGMEICAVKIVDRQYIREGLYIPIDGGGYHEIWEDEKPDTPCWEPQEYFKVNNSMCIENTVRAYDYTATFAWPVDMWVDRLDKECFVVAIKGISDTNTDTK